MPTAAEEAQLKATHEATTRIKGTKVTSVADLLAAMGAAEDAQTMCWICECCFEMVVSDDPTPPPSKCMFCGGTAFKKAL
jgi:rubrerythrin